MNIMNTVIKWTSAHALGGSGLLGQMWRSWRRHTAWGHPSRTEIFSPIPTCLSLLLTSLIALIFFVFDDLEVLGHCILWSLYYALSNRNLGSQAYELEYGETVTGLFLRRVLTEKKGQVGEEKRSKSLCFGRQSLGEDGQVSRDGLICTEMKLDLGWSSRVWSIIHCGGDVLQASQKIRRWLFMIAPIWLHFPLIGLERCLPQGWVQALWWSLPVTLYSSREEPKWQLSGSEERGSPKKDRNVRRLLRLLIPSQALTLALSQWLHHHHLCLLPRWSKNAWTLAWHQGNKG